MSWFAPASKTMCELRLHLCQTSAGSQGLREFIMKNYVPMKKAVGPQFPILVREASGSEARAIARYDYGVEKKISLDNLKSSEIQDKLKQLIQQQQ
ncbi:hypothetical protein MIR68_009777 [Amoeboaphelidium protococcarum]|nr:hypothetical protein MIR68_009777 [Amoeboaphelidium protococcarum]